MKPEIRELIKRIKYHEQTIRNIEEEIGCIEDGYKYIIVPQIGDPITCLNLYTAVEVYEGNKNNTGYPYLYTDNPDVLCEYDYSFTVNHINDYVPEKEDIEIGDNYNPYLEDDNDPSEEEPLDESHKALE